MKGRKKKNTNRRRIVSYSFLVRYQYVVGNTYAYKILHMLDKNRKKNEIGQGKKKAYFIFCAVVFFLLLNKSNRTNQKRMLGKL
jgi:ABC-type multidrug transport system permease subunit